MSKTLFSLVLIFTLVNNTQEYDQDELELFDYLGQYEDELTDPLAYDNDFASGGQHQKFLVEKAIYLLADKHEATSKFLGGLEDEMLSTRDLRKLARHNPEAMEFLANVPNELTLNDIKGQELFDYTNSYTLLTELPDAISPDDLSDMAGVKRCKFDRLRKLSEEHWERTKEGAIYYGEKSKEGWESMKEKYEKTREIRSTMEQNAKEQWEKTKTGANIGWEKTKEGVIYYGEKYQEHAVNGKDFVNDWVQKKGPNLSMAGPNDLGFIEMSSWGISAF